ncbi:MAG: hypothetical protein ACREBE_17890, partial [bacterium]
MTDAPIAAAFTAVPSGTQFRATFAPLQALAYHEVLSELRLSTVYDSKTNLLSIGASVAYNPFSWRGERVFELIEELDRGAGCGQAYIRMTPNLPAALERQERANTALANARVGDDQAAIARADA